MTKEEPPHHAILNSCHQKGTTFFTRQAAHLSVSSTAACASSHVRYRGRIGLRSSSSCSSNSLPFLASRRDKRLRPFASACFILFFRCCQFWRNGLFASCHTQPSSSCHDPFIPPPVRKITAVNKHITYFVCLQTTRFYSPLGPSDFVDPTHDSAWHKIVCCSPRARRSAFLNRKGKAT